MEEARVYKWTNIETGKFYIGRHKGQDRDGYISSGKMYNAYDSMYMKMPDLPRDEQDLFYITKQINKLLSANTKENGFKHHVEIRRLRKLKAKLLKSA